jgi:hypothetical protein
MLTPVVDVRSPVVQGVIGLRAVVVYRLDPSVVLDLMPAPFEAKVLNGFAVGAISLSRLTEVRPQGLPAWLGASGEHATHCFAAKWADERRPAVGLFVQRRHTSSRLTAVIGDRLFPGVRERARFTVEDDSRKVHLGLSSGDGSTRVDVAVEVTDELIGSELFGSSDEASQLLRRGAVDYSLRRKGGLLDGLEMRTQTWRIEPTRIDHARSSYFDDLAAFPAGTAAVDSAFVMRDITADWRAAPPPVTSKGVWLH